jgi:hypothetical protein
MPYIEELFSVGKVANGYVLTVQVPYEVLEAEEGSDKPMPVNDSNNRSFFAKTEKELSKLVAKLVPLIGPAKTKKDYDSAFKEATSK